MRRALPVLAAAILAVGAGLLLGADYALLQLAFVATLALAGLGLVVIMGQCGQLSLGHGASLALGAYALALGSGHGLPWPLALLLAGAAGGLGGALASLPAARLGGIALGMSTLAFSLLLQEGLLRWESLTRGSAGLRVPAPALAGWALDSPLRQAAASLLVLALAGALLRRLLASRQGRAWRALREDEGAAAACGVDPAAHKRRAFWVGGVLGGLAGGLQASWLGYIGPEQFGLKLSFELLMLVFIGGLRRPAGALWGALVLVGIPQLIALARDHLPGVPAGGLEAMAFGAVLVAVVMWRPDGIARARARD